MTLALLRLLFLPAWLLAGDPGAAAAGHGAAVDELMRSLVPDGAPGAAVLVVDHGQIAHEGGYGLADVPARLPITTDTVFDVGSVSKQFTAMAVMILADQGEIAYDDSLRKFYPEFPPYADQITVRHLLHHTAGLPDYMGLFERRLGKQDRADSMPTSRDTVALLAAQPAPRFTPGTRFEYSNSGYVVLAMIVEQVSGQHYPEFARENIFVPLGMTHTLVIDEQVQSVPHKAKSYAREKDGYDNADQSFLNLIYGDGSVNTTLGDLYLWDQALSTEKLVKAATLRTAFTPARLASGASTGYGFGWMIGEDGGTECIEHGGAWLGFRAAIVRYPGARLSVVVLSNLAQFDPTGTAKRIAHLWLPPALGPAAAPRKAD